MPKQRWWIHRTINGKRAQCNEYNVWTTIRAMHQTLGYHPKNSVTLLSPALPPFASDQIYPHRGYSARLFQTNDKHCLCSLWYMPHLFRFIFFFLFYHYLATIFYYYLCFHYIEFSIIWKRICVVIIVKNYSFACALHDSNITEFYICTTIFLWFSYIFT